MKTTITEQLNEVRREISMRQRVYARQVDQGRITQETMDARIDIMRDIEANLKGRSEFDLFDEEDAWTTACKIRSAVEGGDRTEAVNLVRGITDDSKQA